MRAITLDAGESEVFARAALALKYDEDRPAPITESQILMPRRHDDDRRDLWSVFNRTQENLTKGGLSARAANGRRQTTRPVQGIDQSVRLNRALRSEEHTSELQSLMRISYAVFCLKKKKTQLSQYNAHHKTTVKHTHNT